VRIAVATKPVYEEATLPRSKTMLTGGRAGVPVEYRGVEAAA
jgi:hypothetical protein